LPEEEEERELPMAPFLQALGVVALFAIVPTLALAQQSTPTQSAPTPGVAPSYPGSGYSADPLHRRVPASRLENPEARVQRCAQMTDRGQRESCEDDLRRNDGLRRDVLPPERIRRRQPK
jgi:hypothetical protein